MTNSHQVMRLYSKQAERLYLNTSERIRFKKALKATDKHTQLLGLTLLHTGCRISEALNLRQCDTQKDEGIIAIISLKKRRVHHVREVPVPKTLTKQLAKLITTDHEQGRIWSYSRSTAWRRIKQVMRDAEIQGAQATPKGLRHAFGVHCAFSNVAMPLCQKWMGHADIQTTAIYYQIVGSDERDMARRMWD